MYMRCKKINTHHFFAILDELHIIHDIFPLNYLTYYYVLYLYPYSTTPLCQVVMMQYFISSQPPKVPSGSIPWTTTKHDPKVHRKREMWMNDW